MGHVVLTYHAFILELVSTLQRHCPEECHQKSLKYIGHGGLNWLCRLFMVSRETEWSRSLVPGYLVLFSLQLPERKSLSEWVQIWPIVSRIAVSHSCTKCFTTIYWWLNYTTSIARFYWWHAWFEIYASRLPENLIISLKCEDKATMNTMSKGFTTMSHKNNAFDERILWSDVGIWQARCVFVVDRISQSSTFVGA